MIDQVYLQEAYLGGIPFGEPYGYPPVEEGRRFGSGTSSLEMEYFPLMFEFSVYGSGTDCLELFCDLIGNKDLLELSESCYFSLEERSESLATGVIKDLPHFCQGSPYIAIIDYFSFLSPAGAWGKERVYLADDIFPILMSIPAILIQHGGLLLSRSGHEVSLLQFSQVLIS